MLFMAKIKTERAWLNSTTPSSLLLTLKGKRLPRQRRLFAAACCRRWLHEMLDTESRLAIEVAERYADGATGGEELEAAYRAAQQVAARRIAPCLAASESDAGPLWSVWRLAHAAQLACAPSGMEDAAGELLRWIAQPGHVRGFVDGKQLDQEKRAQCACIRDIFGNPFRPRSSIHSSWITWNNRTIPQLAQAIYVDRAFDRLPILADALEEAGCTDADILGHCRSGGEHVRGCWVVDLVLGKS
jgi:hypothetical protein